MAKIKVQAQHLKAGDVVGSGETIHNVFINSIHWPSNKVCIRLQNKTKTDMYDRIWGKYTMINVERADANS